MARYCDGCNQPATWIRPKPMDANGYSSEAVCDKHKEPHVLYDSRTGERILFEDPNTAPWMRMTPAKDAIIHSAEGK